MIDKLMTLSDSQVLMVFQEALSTVPDTKEQWATMYIRAC